MRWLKGLAVWVLLVLILGSCSWSREVEHAARNGFCLSQDEKALVKDSRNSEQQLRLLQEERVRAYLLAHPDIKEPNRSYMLNLMVVPGMTEEQVRIVFGMPEKVLSLENDPDSYPADVLWLYARGVREYYRFYFQDSGLIRIEIGGRR
ncbi:MAG: hypothetical protein JW937_06425 [Candidatus Omnitrophica bacterium]|nr:hypothetical protein [Candidatus Omnitrophota bacterium]